MGAMSTVTVAEAFMGINIIKRDGQKVPIDLNKMHRVVEFACAGIDHVSPSMVEINSEIKFFDGMTTAEISRIMIRSAVELITDKEDGHVNYEYVAGRLVIYENRKDAYGQYDPPPLIDIIRRGVDAGMYDPELLVQYQLNEIQRIEDTILRHEYDERMTYAQAEQIIKKYLVRNKVTGQCFESPQARYIIQAMAKYMYDGQGPDGDRIELIAQEYEFTSQGMYTLPTPQLAGLGTKTRQFSSCVLIKAGDTLESIYTAGQQMGMYAAKRAGIGFDFGRIRPMGAPVRGGEVRHTGMLGFLHKWFRDLRCCSQGGIRNASASMSYPMWRHDFPELIILKNNKGTEESRVRHVDYSVTTSGYFLMRYVNGEDITLFDPNEVPDMYEAFYQDPSGLFIELYEKYEKDPSIKMKRVMSAEEIFDMAFTERSETRIYMTFIDNVVRHGVYKGGLDTVYQSNLCKEITIVTRESQFINDPNGRIGLCTLASTHLPRFKTPQEMRPVARAIVRGLDNILDMQEYLFLESKLHTEEYRPLGVGITGLAEWHAQRGYKYGEPEALQEYKVWLEHLNYYLIEASIDLAIERGPATRWKYTKWADGEFPWERRKAGVNELADFTPSKDLDWEHLRHRMVTHGMRHCNLMAVAPVESSSVAINSTNGMALPKDLISTKESKAGIMTQVVPGYLEYGDRYQTMWETDVSGYLKTSNVGQVYVDQSLSTDTFYNPANWGGFVPRQRYVSDIIDFYNRGGKTLYYSLINSNAAKEGRMKVEEPICESCVL